MKSQTLKIRAVRFAYLFGPPRLVPRAEAAQLHSTICDRLGLDDITFAYNAPKSQEGNPTGFSLLMERKEAGGGWQVLLENSRPMRLFLSSLGPQSMPQLETLFDATAETVFSGLDGTWQKVMAEARVRAECEVEGENSLAFLREHVLRFTPDGTDAEQNQLATCSVKYKLGPSASSPAEPLAGPERELSLEPLLGNPRSLYLELVSRWTQLPSAIPPGNVLDARRIRKIEGAPSAYVKDAYSFLEQKARSLETETSVG